MDQIQLCCFSHCHLRLATGDTQHYLDPTKENALFVYYNIIGIVHVCRFEMISVFVVIDFYHKIFVCVIDNWI